jgi:uncharacterized membrane protein YccC
VPKPDELIFALKTFLGAMAALYLALWLGLDNPYWSMATAYIVAQPLTGAMRSKALYRFCGTILGGIAAVALVPNLVNAPVLLCLAMSCWIGLCLYLSLLDRSPRAYLFMLAGYTAGIIGFPSVTAPGSIFETALTRVEEICIGIACTTMMGTIVFPRPLGPVLATRMLAWMKPGRDWAVAALRGQEEDAQTWACRRRLAAEAADIGMMTTQLAYDTSHLQRATRQVERLRLYVLSIMPVLSSIGDRVAQLKTMREIPPSLQKLLDDCAAWMADSNANPDGADALERAILAQEQNTDAIYSWPGVLRTTLLVRLHELVAMARHSRAIRRHVLDDAPPDNQPDADGLAAPLHVRDHGLAFLSALAAGIATLLVCAFWIFTGWKSGAGAAVIVAVACSFFAAQDDPAPAIALMLRNAVIIALADAVYVFVFLPRVETFSELVLVLLPAGMVIGVLVSRPATFGTGMVMGAVGSTVMALGNGYNGDFAGYTNGVLALLLGLAAALVITRVIRSVGAAWSARRLLRAGWRDIAAAASRQGSLDRGHMTGVMLDRLGLLMPRLAAVSPGADIAAADVLLDLRVGLNVIGLQRALEHFSPAGQVMAVEVLEGIAAHYRGNPLQPPDDSLLKQMDRTILALSQVVGSAHGRHHRQALMMLVGMRSILFADAPSPFLEMAEAA